MTPTAGDVERLERRLERRLGQAIGDFELIEPGDRVLVGVSGGKDSWALLHLLRRLQRKAPARFELIALNVDQGFGGFRADIVDASPDSLIVEVTGTEDKVDAIVEMLKPHGIRELVRTGRVAVSRGAGAGAVIEGAEGEGRRFRSAGEGKPKVGSLL